MTEGRRKVLSAYDGSAYGDAALDDLRRAGLPREAEALIVSIAEVLMAPPPSVYEVVGPPLTSQRVASAVARSEAQAAQALDEVNSLATKAGDWKSGLTSRIGRCRPKVAPAGRLQN